MLGAGVGAARVHIGCTLGILAAAAAACRCGCSLNQIYGTLRCNSILSLLINSAIMPEFATFLSQRDSTL